MPTLDPIPANLWRQIRAFCASGQPGQITLHLGNRRCVEKATFTYTVPGADDPHEPPPPRHPSGPLAAVLRDVFEPPL
jgi:hypothetical protein